MANKERQLRQAQQMIAALTCLQKAFILSRKAKKIPHRFNEDIGYIKHEAAVELYEIKSRYINAAIQLIKKHQLPIKYGKEYDVVLFEIRSRKGILDQVSFHDPKNRTKCKRFPGAWNGKKRIKRFQFAGLLASLKRENPAVSQ
jgi:hypothetical protein